MPNLFASLAQAEEEKEIRLKIKVEDFRSYGEKFVEDLREFAAESENWSVVPNTYEGVCINADSKSGDGWLLARLSVHDPVIPVNFESRSKGGTLTAAKILLDFTKNYPELDCSALEEYCG